MTMRTKGSFIAALLAMMVMLSACGWLDQLWNLAKTGRALTTMESVTADIATAACFRFRCMFKLNGAGKRIR